VTGSLKGYDALMNLVLDDVEEMVRGKPPHIPTRRFLSMVLLVEFHLLTFMKMMKETSRRDPWVWWLLEERYWSLSAPLTAVRR
jgi:hypothetical protein